MQPGAPLAPSRLPATPWGHLPPQLRTLFITGRRRIGAWLAEALAADSASEILLEETLGAAAGMARLRDQVYDAVLISQEDQEVDALELLDAIRAGSRDHQAIVVLGEEDEPLMAAQCFEAGADAYVCLHTATTRGLIWQLARAVERHELLSDNRRLQQARQQQLRREHDEADRLLRQQRTMISGLEGLLADESKSGAADRRHAAGHIKPPPPLPDWLTAHYRELLRTYIIMGSGNLASELQRLTAALASLAITPQQVLSLHVMAVEETVGGLGNRSTRHVMNRADMLILEVMVNLAEGFRRQLLGEGPPARQRLLPGFEPAERSTE